MKRLLLFFMVAVLTLGSTYAKSVAFIYTSGYNSGNAAKYGLAEGGYTLDQDPVYAALCDNFEVTPFDSPSGNEADYETLRTYDCVVISEAISGNTTLSNNLVKLVGTVPIVSMKAYNYTSGRWSWAAPANPGTQTNGFYIYPGFESHPLFAGLVKETDGCINIYDPDKTPSSNRIQGFTTANIIADSQLAAETDKLMGYAKSGDTDYNCVHEIANAGDYKYILVSMSSDNIWAVNENGQKIIVNAVKYVTGEAAIDMEEITAAYLYDSSYSGYCGIDDDPIFNNTKVAEVNSVAIDIKDFTAANTDTLEALENFDIVLISEAMGSGHAFIKGVAGKINRVPMINFKSFLYKNTAWNMGAGQNPTKASDNGGIATITIDSAFMEDPLFADVEIVEGKVNMFIESDPATVKKNLVQGYTVSAGSLFEKDDVLAKVGTYNAIHRHGTKNMYVLLPLSSDAMCIEGENNLSDDAIQIINNAIDMVYATKSGVTPCATPSISFEYGDEVTTVTLACNTADAKIYYTLDETDPTEASVEYGAPFRITKDSTVVKAIAVKQGFDNSAVAKAVVSVKRIAKTPIITLKWEEGYSVITLHKTTADADIYYNFTGSAKEDESGVYAGPITVYEPVTVTAFASGGAYLASAPVSQAVAIQGVNASNIRLDTIAWFNANKEDWYWETAGGNSKVAYYMQKTAMSIYAKIDTLVGAANDTSYQYTYNDFKYYAKNAATADSSDWVIKTQGQTLYWESTQPGSTVYSGTSAYMVYRAEDLITKPSDYHITFGAKISGEPYTGSIETTKKYKGPFDIIVFNGNNNGSSAEFDVKVEVSADGENWTAVDSLYFPPVQRILVRNVSSYEGTDEVFVRVKHYGGSTKAVVYDIMLLNNGTVSQAYVPAGLKAVVAGAEVLRTEFYSLTGLRLAAPSQQGITIVKTIFTNGAVKVEKVLFR